jgi:hypothetical protein
MKMKKDPRQANDRLISGRLRPKAARSGAKNKIVMVDGVGYAWVYRHGWRVWGKDIRIVSISVSLRPDRTRELILDFTVTVSPQDDMPSETRLAQALPAAIRSACDAGWDPESRGRAFRFEVAASM